LSSYKNLYEQLRQQRMSSVRPAIAEVSQAHAVAKSSFIPR
jgi:hypothetical protein